MYKMKFPGVFLTFAFVAMFCYMASEKLGAGLFFVGMLAEIASYFMVGERDDDAAG